MAFFFPSRCSMEFKDYPVDDYPPIPDGWTDISWHNDPCPCFKIEASSNALVYLDYRDNDEREIPDMSRFIVMWPGTTSGADDEWVAYPTNYWLSVIKVLEDTRPRLH